MINLQWFTEHYNWGDAVNPYLVKAISNDQVQLINDPNKKRHLCVGSVIHLADDNCTVWGSGFIAPNHHTAGKPKVLAVRGPKTRDKLIADGIECPEVFGDPVLLLPRYYHPKVEKKYEFGIIIHYAERGSSWVERFRKMPFVKIIDIQNDVEEVPQQVLSCNMIFSSSLHGVILSDAYGIPSYWIKLSNRLGDFKFEDYLMSVKRKTTPILINSGTSIKNLKSQIEPYEIDIDLEALMDSCPFKPTTKLSILICTLSDRNEKLGTLLEALNKQSEDKPVEILYVGDNRTIGVGKKRNDLLRMARGEYISFIDDDDRISDDYIDQILSKIKLGTDCVVFDVEISENGSPYKKVVYDINLDRDLNYPDHYERLPNHLMAVKRDIALKAMFPEIQFAEDAEYAKRLKQLLNSQSRISKTLYYYDFNDKTSATRD